MKKAIMEFIGTFFFVLTIIMTGNPIAIASMLMAWVYIGGYVSGGHYNPAVSLAVAISHHWHWMTFIKYMIAQVLGAFTAFMAAFFLTGKSILTLTGEHVSYSQVFVMEALLAFVLASVVLMVATSHKFRDSKVFGAAIGFTIPALALLGAPISGGIFNPAIILGSALSIFVKTGYIGWKIAALYIPAQLLGGALAACVFKYLNVDHNEKH